ncbi:tetratricopeptide repeat protein [Peredibacter starrii]|uniref:Tetratricopeptide repeat protein n=1 Tax=Peredibacter starrii TaxID=28202 RepID=A0AAX4HIV0_9BACT|nr:hypothetical protein [Peredibacter starrii]WPU63165.1 hypothetical protein SOO65_10760 [Peredibacter starrii]
MKLLILGLLAFGQVRAAEIDLPIRTDGGSVSYSTPDLLSRRGELSPPPSIYDLEELNRVLFSERRLQTEELKKIKYYLINGDIRMARAHLLKLTFTQTKLKPVVHRYLAILHFIDGEFAKSFHYLSQPELQNIPQYSKICTLKVLNEIVLNKTTELENDWNRCRVENAYNLKALNMAWLDTLVQLKIAPVKGVTAVPFKFVRLAAFDRDEAKVMMKLSLYLNQEQLLLDQIPELTVEQLQDPEIRELAGQILFRTGALAKSYKYLEDLKSPNAENIKGNLYVLRNKYELAYAQFKLALEQKQNSQNALERLLPLAWLLGDWEGGSVYAERVMASPQTQINKMTLNAAFLMQKGDYSGANKVLEAIAQRSRRGTDLEVTQLGSFTALMQNQPDNMKKQASLSCSQYDIINCWVLFQLSQWDSFPLTVRRDDKLADKKEWEKLIKEDLNQPLKETVYVNQLDIEEMDDKLIQLIPKSP